MERSLSRSHGAGTAHVAHSQYRGLFGIEGWTLRQIRFPGETGVAGCFLFRCPTGERRFFNGHRARRSAWCIAEICRKEGIARNFYYRWSKGFFEAGTRRSPATPLVMATSDEVKTLRAEARTRGLVSHIRWLQRRHDIGGVKVQLMNAHIPQAEIRRWRVERR